MFHYEDILKIKNKYQLFTDSHCFTFNCSC